MKIGMVLAGGGARGAYQIGVWKALRELGIDKYISVVSGTSIGALNAILFINGDLDFAEDLWDSIKVEEVLPVVGMELKIKSFLLELGINNLSFVKKHMPKAISGGNISREGLNKIIERIDIGKICRSDIKCYVSCTVLPEIIVKYFLINDHDEEYIKKVLLATSAIPGIYDCELIDELEYLDGGIVDNVPIQAIYGEACDLIIVVNLSKESSINKSLFPNTRILEITPSIIEGGNFKGILEFNSELSKKRISLGYSDTINSVAPIMNLTRYIDSVEKREKSIRNKIKKTIANALKKQYK